MQRTKTNGNRIRCQFIRRGEVHKTGFTLIELLVVIAIISLLVSILLPSLQNAKLLAQGVVCASNLKNIGVGFEMYRADFEDWYPQYCMSGTYHWPSGSSETHWGAYISEYLGWNGAESTADSFRRSGNWDCPTAPGIPDDVYFDWGYYNWSLWSWHCYGYNIRLGDSGNNRWYRGDEIDLPAEKILVGDASGPTITGRSIGSLTPQSPLLAKRHLPYNPEGNPNIVFADGHVSTVSFSEMYKVDEFDVYIYIWADWMTHCGLKHWFPNKNWDIAKQP